MRDYNEIKKALESRKDKSKWDKGVTLYALELLEKIEENLSFEGKFYSDFTNKADFEEYALNGARTWKDFSFGGCSLIYDYDICERLATPTEAKRTNNGQKDPNPSETWLDCQARALYQAFERLYSVAK